MGRCRTQLTMQKKRSDENKYNLAQLNRRTNYFVSAQVAFTLFSIVRLYRSCCCTNLGDIFQRVVVASRIFCPLVVFFLYKCLYEIYFSQGLSIFGVVFEKKNFYLKKFLLNKFLNLTKVQYLWLYRHKLTMLRIFKNFPNKNKYSFSCTFQLLCSYISITHTPTHN